MSPVGRLLNSGAPPGKAEAGLTWNGEKGIGIVGAIAAAAAPNAYGVARINGEEVIFDARTAVPAVVSLRLKIFFPSQPIPFAMSPPMKGSPW